MMNLADQIGQGTLNARIVQVISSRAEVTGVERGRELGLEVEIVRPQGWPDVEAFSERLAEVFDEAKVDLVCQCGWLCYWRIPKRYEGRVMNIHPALLPSFGGKGMWGEHVHAAVLKAGGKTSGCTVHYVNNEYDAGPVILQRSCPVLEGDDVETLAARVFAQECIAYPEAIRLFGEEERNREVVD